MLSLPAATGAAGPPLPEGVGLTAGWQFLPDPSDAGVGRGYPSGTAGSGWRPVTSV